MLVLSFSMMLYTNNYATAEYAAPASPPSLDGRFFLDDEQFGLIINDNGVKLEDGLDFGPYSEEEMVEIKAFNEKLVNDWDGGNLK